MAAKTDTQAPSEQENSVQGNNSVKKNSLISNIILAVCLVMLLVLPLIFTRLNLMGAGDMLRPILKDNSVFKYVLPPSANSNNISTMSRQELLKLIDKNKATIASLENQIKILQQVSEVYTGDSNGFQKFDDEKASVATQKAQIDAASAQLQADKTSFFEQIKNADRASFESYYKKIDSITAQKLYQESLQQDKVDSRVADYVSYYSGMEAASAASIFEKLSITDSNLVTNILFYMEKDKASKILEAMDPKIASGISAMLAKKTPIGH